MYVHFNPEEAQYVVNASEKQQEPFRTLYAKFHPKSWAPEKQEALRARKKSQNASQVKSLS